MSSLRVNSFHNLLPSPSTSEQSCDDSTLEGVATNVKLLLKLIQDHKEGYKGNRDDLKMLRVGTMMTILDNVKTRIQKCQSVGDKETKLRRCNTDVKLTSNLPKDKKQQHELVIDEKDRLKRQLNASLVARKSLEAMCSSLGKEKEIMVAELSKKAHELSEMEDLINELKEENECLVERLYGCETERNDTNKQLFEQLLRSVDGYQSMKRKWKNAHEENMAMHAMLEEMGAKIVLGLDRIRCFRERISSESMPEEIVELEHMFQSFETHVARHFQNMVR